jgi:hypothetical protein
MRKVVAQAVAQVGAMDQESMWKAVAQAVAQVGAMDQKSMWEVVAKGVAAMNQESMRRVVDAHEVDTAVVQVTDAATGQPTPSARKQLGAGEDE